MHTLGRQEGGREGSPKRLKSMTNSCGKLVVSPFGEIRVPMIFDDHVHPRPWFATSEKHFLFLFPETRRTSENAVRRLEALANEVSSQVLFVAMHNRLNYRAEIV